MILRNPTRHLRYLFIFMTVTSLLFVYYASSSMYVKATVFQFYQQINQFQKELVIIDSVKTDPTILFENRTHSMRFNNFSASFSDDRAFLNASSAANTTSSPDLITSPSNSTFLEPCPLIPPDLGTRIKIDLNALKISEIENQPSIKRLHILPGGKGAPSTCKARFRVAIIIPYRDRLENLQLFLNHMHPFLSKQQLDYGIYLVEPVKDITFNRGLLMNIGYKEADRDSDKWDCFVFHDVDLLPEDERNIYSCPEIPRHLSAAVSTFKYKLPYGTIFGGVTGFSKEHFQRINGFSNLYFGWGGEDDDLRNRVIKVGLSVARYPLEIGRYFMAKHSKDKPNPQRFKLLKSGKKRLNKDGITSLKYKVERLVKNPLYTHIMVSYNQTDIMGSSDTK